MPRRAKPVEPEIVALSGKVIIQGDRQGTLRSLSARFLADLQDDWEKHGAEILGQVAARDPVAYLMAMVTLSKVDRKEVGGPGAFTAPRSVDDILKQVEERTGPKGRKEFEKFLERTKDIELKPMLEGPSD